MLAKQLRTTSQNMVSIYGHARIFVTELENQEFGVRFTVASVLGFHLKNGIFCESYTDKTSKSAKRRAIALAKKQLGRQARLSKTFAKSL
jgi:hypothetical protein